MHSKLLLGLSVGLLTTGALTQDVIAQFDLYSDSQCGGDPNNLETLSTTMEFLEESEGAASSPCTVFSIDYNDWPANKDGLYEAWVDTTKLGVDCHLQFFNFLDSEQEDISPEAACKQLYREFSWDGHQCASLRLGRHFGAHYCCGNDCNRPEWHERSLTPTLRDVTKIKRSPLLDRSVKEKRELDCKYVKDDDAYTTYGPQVKITDKSPCPPDQTTCGNDFTYTTGTEVTDGWNIQVEVGVELFKIVSASVSGGYEHSDTTSSSFAVTQHLAPEGGTKAYVTFTPLLACGKGHMEGSDCGTLGGFLSLEDKLEHAPFCVPKMNSYGEPQGEFGTVQTD